MISNKEEAIDIIKEKNSDWKTIKKELIRRWAHGNGFTYRTIHKHIPTDRLYELWWAADECAKANKDSFNEDYPFDPIEVEEVKKTIVRTTYIIKK